MTALDTPTRPDDERPDGDAGPDLIDPLEVDPDPQGGSWAAFRRGLDAMPELRIGVGLTIVLGLVMAAGRVVVPILIQQILDRGILGPDGYRPGFVAAASIGGAVLVIALWLAGRATIARLNRAAEAGLAGLRVRTFAHIHALSTADHAASRRGVLVARVTSDVETLAQFWQWGAMLWITSSAAIVGVLVVMVVYAWQLAVVSVATFAPVVFLVRWLQKRQLAAWDEVRTRAGDTLGEFSEAIGGATVIRAYGLEGRGRRRLRQVIEGQRAAEVRAQRLVALMFPLGDLFGALAVAVVAAVGVWQGPQWGLDAGELVAFVFLVTMLAQPIAELGEILDQTQSAAAGIRKVVSVLDLPIEVVEPDPGLDLPPGPLAVAASGAAFAYRSGPVVLRDVDLDLPAGSSIAIVGETGSGKSTLASLLARLADPTEGTVEIGGIDLRQVAPASRHTRIRMVPQDGFLFAGTVRHNIGLGRLGASDADIERAIDELGLRWWVERMPAGLDTEAGERGGSLSVGERQLVALVRAQVSDPGLLILDEATSAVDPETERALAVALTRLAAGRTTVTVAHRLSTAERADLVLVVDDGRIVERGTHAALVAAGGTYAALHRSWVGGTRPA